MPDKFIDDKTNLIIEGILEGLASKYLNNELLAEIKVKVAGYDQEGKPLLLIKTKYYQGEA